MSLKSRQLDAAIKAARELEPKLDTMSADEREAFEKRIDGIEQLKAEVKREEAVAAAISDAVGPHDDGDEPVVGDLYDALQAAGFDLKTNPSVEVPVKSMYARFGRKADLIATEADGNPVREGGVAEMGRDSRYVFPNLPSKGIPFETTAVQFLRQTTRTLAAPADMQLDITSATDKPVTQSVATLVTEEPIIVANVSDLQPNVLFGIPDLRTMLQSDLEQAWREGVDDYVIDTIRAASGINTLAQGTDITLDAIAKIVGDVMDDGFTPNLVILNKDDLEAVRLSKDDISHYIDVAGFFREIGVKPVSSKTLTAGKVLAVDTSVLQLRLSPVRAEVNPYEQFLSNRSRMRVESLAHLAVKQATGIGELTLN